MYRIKVTGYVQYLEGEDPYTSLQNREYGKDFEAFEYVNSFRDPSVMDRDFKTEEEARLAMAKSYRGVDDYGLGLTWTVVRRGSIVVKGAEAVAYAGKNGEPLYVLGDLGEPDAQVDFARAHQILQNEPNRVYTTADPYYISAKAQVFAQSRVGDNVSLCRAPGLGEEADAWWYYLESEGSPEVIDPENPDPKVADALHMSEEDLRQILDFHLTETREEQGRTTGTASICRKRAGVQARRTIPYRDLAEHSRRDTRGVWAGE